MKKLYNVSVSFDVIVLAENEDDAYEIASENKDIVFENLGLDNKFDLDVYELEDCPEGCEDSFPYVECDESNEETIGEIFDKIKEEKLRKKRESCMKPLFECKERNKS